MSYSNASLADAYLSIYEGNAEVEELGYSMIENAAYVLFSQGYTAEDVIDYFIEAKTEVITEDYVNFSEGRYLIESVSVSEEYIDEQYEQLNEILGLIAKGAKALARPVAGLIQKGAAKLASGAGKVAQKAADVKWKATPADAKNLLPPAGAKSAAPAIQSAAKPGLLQRAGTFAKGLMSKAKDVVKKIPGAGAAAKLAKGPVGKIASRVAPGLGVAAYGMDAASRFKKGDWGGGLLSTAGAVTSAIPGAGTIAALAPAAIQMGTDALGLTGDKSKKASAAPKPTKPTAPKPVITPSKPSPSAAAKPTTPAAPKPAVKQTGDKTKDMKTWAAANPKLAAAQAERERTRGTAQTSNPLMKDFRDKMPAGTPTVQAPEVKDLGKGYQSLTDNPYAGKSPEKKKQPVGTKTESYDVILAHLLENNYASTEEQAHAIMSHMSEGWKNAITSEGYQRDPEKGETPDRSREAIPGQAPRGMPPRGNADREAFEKWYRLQQASKKEKSAVKA